MAAAIVIRRRDATRPIGRGRLGTRGPAVVRRMVAGAAAAALIGATGAVLVQLVAELLGFPAPVAAIGITVLTAGLLGWLRRQLRTGSAKRRRVSRQV